MLVFADWNNLYGTVFRTYRTTREVADEVDALNGRLTTHKRCREAFAAYEAVPAHNRMYLGDMDTKDNDIRRILFPNEYAEWDEES